MEEKNIQQEYLKNHKKSVNRNQIKKLEKMTQTLRVKIPELERKKFATYKCAQKRKVKRITH